MRDLKPFCIIAFLTLCISSISHAQPSFQGGGNFALGFPQGEFNDNVDVLGYGFTGYFLYRLPAPSFNVGLAFNYLVYGSETREEPWSQTIPDVFVDVTTTNDILYGHLMLRIQSPIGFIRPYIDGLFGFGHFSTDTKVENQEADDEEDREIAKTTHSRDTALNFGFGGGLMIRLYNASGELAGALEAVSIDLGIRYLKGGKAEYMKEGSIEIIDGNLYYNILHSNTDIITGHIGVSFDFTIHRPQ